MKVYTQQKRVDVAMSDHVVYIVATWNHASAAQRKREDTRIFFLLFVFGNI